jgi:hypothetical protein
MFDHSELHDATLVAVHVSWGDGKCVADIKHRVLGQCILTFLGVSRLTLPRTQEWGPSSSINSFTRRNAGRYQIGMQSGHVIEVSAAQVMLTQTQ